MVAANRAAEQFFDIDVEDEAVDKESGWFDWEDLYGTRVQTDSEGLLRIITQTNALEESLVWVEKKSLTIEEEEESGVAGTDLVDDSQKDPTKRRKVCTYTIFLAQI